MIENYMEEMRLIRKSKTIDTIGGVVETIEKVTMFRGALKINSSNKNSTGALIYSNESNVIIVNLDLDIRFDDFVEVRDSVFKVTNNPDSQKTPFFSNLNLKLVEIKEVQK